MSSWTTSCRSSAPARLGPAIRRWISATRVSEGRVSSCLVDLRSFSGFTRSTVDGRPRYSCGDMTQQSGGTTASPRGSGSGAAGAPSRAIARLSRERVRWDGQEREMTRNIRGNRSTGSVRPVTERQALVSACGSTVAAHDPAEAGAVAVRSGAGTASHTYRTP